MYFVLGTIKYETDNKTKSKTGNYTVKTDQLWKLY